MVTSQRQQNGQFAFGAGAAQGQGFGSPVRNTSTLEPELQVIFKALQKRDALTRIKGSDDFIVYLDSSLGDTPDSSQEALIRAFVGLYPVLTLDVDRRVRANGHIAIGKLVQTYKKGIVKYLSECAPYWQLGLHDGDRLVSKAATEAFETSFPTLDKQQEFTRRFSPSIIERCTELILEEDANSLSDSRFVSEDDAEAKYSNTCGAALSVLAEISTHDRQAQLLLVNDSRLWKLVQTQDANVQKAGLALIGTAVAIHGLLIISEKFNASMASLMSHILPANLVSLIQLLQAVSSFSPESVFLSTESSKKTVPARLNKLLGKGPSTTTSDVYWTTAACLLRDMFQLVAREDSSIDDFLASYRSGMTKAPRGQADVAKREYVQLCTAFLRRVPAISEARLLEHFSVDIHQLGPLSMYKQAISEMVLESEDLVVKLISQLGAQALALLDFDSASDLSLVTQWADLMCSLPSPKTAEYGLAQINNSLEKALNSSATRERDYRYALHAFSALSRSNSIDASASLGLLRSLYSKSTKQILSWPDVTLQWLEQVAKSSPQNQSEELLSVLLLNQESHSNECLDLVSKLCHSESLSQSKVLLRWFLDDFASHTSVSEARWELYALFVREAKTSEVLPQFLPVILSAAAQGKSARSNDMLRLISSIAESGIELYDVLDGCMDHILQAIWIWSRSAEPTTVLDSFTVFMQQKSESFRSSLETSVWREVLLTNKDSIPISQLYELFACTAYKQLYKESVLTEMNGALEEILPRTLPSALTIVEPIGVLSNLCTARVSSGSPMYDSQGLSKYFRICYVLRTSPVHHTETIQARILMADALLLTKHQQIDANYIINTDFHSNDQDSALSDFQASDTFVKTATTILAQGGDQSRALLKDLGYSNDSKTSIVHWYEASTLYRILCKVGESVVGQDLADDLFVSCSEDLFFSVAVSTALHELLKTTKSIKFQRNKLASDLTGTIDESQSVLRLIKLNSHLSYEGADTDVLPRQRLIFLVRNLLSYAADHDLSSLMAYEILTLLRGILPNLATEYGTFWKVAIDVIHKILLSTTEGSNDVSSQYAAFKLLAWFWTTYESNDDLSEYWHDALVATEKVVARGFMLAAQRSRNDQANTLCSLIASRLMRKVRTTNIDEEISADITSLVFDSEEHVQLSSYAVQIQLLDAEREEVILSSALAKEYEDISASVPAELLSVVIDCPVEEADIYNTHGLLRTSHRGYFMAWCLIFSFFKDTPLRMRMKLISDLEDLDIIEPLLGLIFAIMKVQDDSPADISAISKSNLDHELIANEGNEMLAYAAHLYFSCLTHVPALVRAWWIDCKDRSLTAAVERLTVKHYSLTLIQHDVQTLQSEQSKALLKDDNLTVRISNGGRDIFTTYEIDEQNMEMAIRLPPNYPLRRVAVEGIQRVGVKDTLWRAWLFGSQAVLTAQNGSVLDAISLFQRNVSLHFEGVAECNICFSVLSVQDKSLPSKKCQTCKNLFHSSCLFKWFKSSSQSRCPLCRTSFAF